MSVFISDDGQYKVEVIETTCRDKRFGELTITQFKAHRWARKTDRWTHLVTTIHLAILAYYVPLSELLEFPSPDWGDDASHNPSEV